MGDGAPERVFVYGTLMPGQPRWPALAGFAAGWEPATAPGRLFDTGRGYPAARFGGAAGGTIPGVVVALDAARAGEAVAALDRIEGEGSLYRRVAVATSAGPALGYEWIGPTAGLAELPGGWPGPPRAAGGRETP